MLMTRLSSVETQVPELARHVLSKDKYEYDVFLSHATEDKDDVARPLALALQERGLRVWYDEFELKIGDNLVAKLNTGINASRFGIIVLSQSFFAKRWTNYELDMLEHLWVTEERLLFPIWHGIEMEQIRAYRVFLANLVGRSTDAYTIEEIANEIHEIVIAYYAGQLAMGSDLI